LSNIVADLNILPQKKTEFYKSELYQSGLLQEYAQLKYYPSSVYAKAVIDITDLIK